MPLWRNWQTHSTQNVAKFLHVGSSPTNGTNDFSVRTNRTELIQNQSENKIWLIFLLFKNNIKIIQTKGWCKKMKIIKQELQFEDALYKNKNSNKFIH